MSVTIKKSELREHWEYEREFYRVCNMFNSLTPAERDGFKGWKLQFLGLLFAPPSLLQTLEPATRGTWLEYIVEDLQASFIIRKTGTPLDFLVK